MLVLHIPYFPDHVTDNEHYDCLEELTIRDMLHEIATLTYDKNKQDHSLFKNVKMILFIELTSEYKLNVAISVNENTIKYMNNNTLKHTEYNLEDICIHILSSYQLFHIILPTFLHYITTKRSKPLIYCDPVDDILYSHYSNQKISQLIVEFVGHMYESKDSSKEEIEQLMDKLIKEKLIVIID